jgi:hypothetical protein
MNGQAVSIWHCSHCGIVGFGDVRIDKICGSYCLTCKAELDLTEPEGWLALTDECLCPDCQGK